MKLEKHWIKDPSDVFESLMHGEKLTKFVAKSESEAYGYPSVEIHGFITDDGEFIIVSEQFKYKEEEAK